MFRVSHDFPGYRSVPSWPPRGTRQKFCPRISLAGDILPRLKSYMKSLSCNWDWNPLEPQRYSEKTGALSWIGWRTEEFVQGTDNVRSLGLDELGLSSIDGDMDSTTCAGHCPRPSQFWFFFRIYVSLAQGTASCRSWTISNLRRASSFWRRGAENFWATAL